MKITPIILPAALWSTLATALPSQHSQLEQRQAFYEPCSGLYGSAQCCATDVLGLANVDCGVPVTTPSNATDFSSICAAIGQRARCCVLPILDQGVLCQTPSGV
ncbi:magnaporin, partial [Parathielavia hyrcaniae]